MGCENCRAVETRPAYYVPPQEAARVYPQQHRPQSVVYYESEPMHQHHYHQREIAPVDHRYQTLPSPPMPENEPYHEELPPPPEPVRFGGAASPAIRRNNSIPYRASTPTAPAAAAAAAVIPTPRSVVSDDGELVIICADCYVDITAPDAPLKCRVSGLPHS